MANKYDIFINYKRSRQLTASCWPCSNLVLPRSSYGVPLVLLWLSHGTLKWLRRAFLDEPSGRSTFGRLQGKKAESEKGSKVVGRYMPEPMYLASRIQLTCSTNLCEGGDEHRSHCEIGFYHH